MRVCHGESAWWLPLAGAWWHEWWVGRVWCYVGWCLVGSTVCVRVCYCESAWWLVGPVVGWGDGAGGHASLPSDRPDTCTLLLLLLVHILLLVAKLHWLHLCHFSPLYGFKTLRILYSLGHLADTSSRHVLESYHAVVCGFHIHCKTLVDIVGQWRTLVDTGRLWVDTDGRWQTRVGALSCSCLIFHPWSTSARFSCNSLA